MVNHHGISITGTVNATKTKKTTLKCCDHYLRVRVSGHIFNVNLYFERINKSDKTVSKILQCTRKKWGGRIHAFMLSTLLKTRCIMNSYRIHAQFKFEYFIYEIVCTFFNNTAGLYHT